MLQNDGFEQRAGLVGTSEHQERAKPRENTQDERDAVTFQYFVQALGVFLLGERELCDDVRDALLGCDRLENCDTNLSPSRSFRAADSTVPSCLALR